MVQFIEHTWQVQLTPGHNSSEQVSFVFTSVVLGLLVGVGGCLKT
jgi:hypothetical protein